MDKSSGKENMPRDESAVSPLECVPEEEFLEVRLVGAAHVYS